MLRGVRARVSVVESMVQLAGRNKTYTAVEIKMMLEEASRESMKNVGSSRFAVRFYFYFFIITLQQIQAS